MMWRVAKWTLASCFASATGVVMLDANNYIDLTSYSAMRAVRTGITTCKIIGDYKWSLLNLDCDSDEYRQAKVQAHSRAADRLLSLCWKNRGTYIKVGQHLGGMDYLLPQEYTRVLKVLHSDAPQSSVEELEKVAMDDLKITGLGELFSEFSDKPLGTASLAQVHKARLKENGEVVAVKIQHPLVRDLADKDMNMMDAAAKLVKWVFPEFELMWLSEETRANLPIELDFTNEAQTCAEAAKNLKCFDWVKLPQIYWQYSTSRVIVMEYMEGGQINDRAYLDRNSIQFKDVARLLGKLFSEMIFVHGFVHSDPHPGNILIRRRKQKLSLYQKIFRNQSDLEIILLDHGLYCRLTKEFRYEYASLWQAIINRDLVALERHARAIGGGDLFPVLVSIVTGRAWKVVGGEGIRNVIFSQGEDDAIRDDATEFLPDISLVLSRIPKEMLLVLKTNDQLRGLEHTFGVRGHQSGFLDMSRCCLRALCELEISKAPPSKNTFLHRFDCYCQLFINLSFITAYEWYMWVSNLIGPTLRSPNDFSYKQVIGAERKATNSK